MKKATTTTAQKTMIVLFLVSVAAVTVLTIINVLAGNIVIYP